MVKIKVGASEGFSSHKRKPQEHLRNVHKVMKKPHENHVIWKKFEYINRMVFSRYALHRDMNSSIVSLSKPRNMDMEPVNYERILGPYTVLFAACDLGVFEALSAGPLDTASVAQVLGLSPHGTQLLLDACAGLGLLRVEGTGAYTLTPPSRDLLLTQGTRSQRSMLLYLGATAYVCWGHLGRAVREGRSQYPQADAVATEEPFAAIYRSEPERLLFMAALQDTWRVCGVRVLKAFDLSPFRVICDVGGGSGALAMACARLYPTSSVCVFDTPEVVAAAQTHFRPLGEAMPVQFYAGDFFRSRLPGAELYILARVLHDWTDNTCLQLLGRLQEAGRPVTSIMPCSTYLSTTNLVYHYCSISIDSMYCCVSPGQKLFPIRPLGSVLKLTLLHNRAVDFISQDAAVRKPNSSQSVYGISVCWTPFAVSVGDRDYVFS
ncbi:hypothetical protein STEG23_023561 [Scotinomys teguina]